MEDDLWKSDSCGPDSERKKVGTSCPGPLACAFMDLAVFGSMETHLPSEKLILPYFSSLSMVAILVCDSHRQAGSSTVQARKEKFPAYKDTGLPSDLPKSDGELVYVGMRLNIWFFVHIGKNIKSLRR